MQCVQVGFTRTPRAWGKERTRFTPHPGAQAPPKKSSHPRGNAALELRQIGRVVARPHRSHLNWPTVQVKGNPLDLQHGIAFAHAE